MSEPFVGQIISVGFQYAPQGWAQCAGQVLPISQQEVLFTLLGTTYGGDGSSTFGIPDLRGRIIVGSGQSPSVGLGFEPGDSGGAAAVTLTGSNLPGHVHAATGTVSLGTLAAEGNVSIPVSAQLSNQSVTVKGALSATTGPGATDAPTAGCTIGDPSGNAKIYASYNPSTAVSLAEFSSTGQLTAQGSGTASGSIELPVTGTPTTVITVSPNVTANQAVPILPPFLAMLSIIALEGIYPSHP